jgi:hypothetical protein
MPDSLAHFLPGRTVRGIRARLDQPPLEVFALLMSQRERFALIGNAVSKLSGPL